jgi:hypothetical protein
MAARIDQINSVVGFPDAVKNVPPNYPTRPQPGKISLLFQYNSQNIYHRFSPYTYGDNVFGLFRNKQPFVYRYPDEAQDSTFNQLPATVKTLAGAGGITQGTLDDVVRVSKLLVSSPEGAIYNIKQLSLQRLNPFDETRVYNPLSPVLATISGMTFGIGQRPRRHIEGSLLTGLLNSVTSTVGINFQSQFKKPDSTAGDTTALPTANIHEGKGMLRGKTSADALATLTSKWTPSSTSPTGLGASLSKAASSFLDSAKNSLTSFFGNPKKSSGQFRADEQAADLMYNSKVIHSARGQGRTLNSMIHPWYSGNKGTTPLQKPLKLYPRPQVVFNNISNPIFGFDTLEAKSRLKIDGKSVGYVVEPNGNWYEMSIHPANDGEYTNSDVLINYADYVDPTKKYESKFIDPISDKVTRVNASLQKVLESFNPRINVTYTAETDINSRLMSFPKNTPDFMGYNSIDPTKNNALLEYDRVRNTPRTVDRSVSPTNTIRMATSFTSDALNQIGVIGKDKKFEASKEYPNYTEYKPYEDDLIAFFFYDVVNQKYIPFRATVKGISEGGTAFWDELRFIGRADQLYSYNGFSRTLSFTFNIVISSLTELLPTWQKVNYMASAVKPSNYTTGAKFGDNRYSRFIVPPMFMLTIGDMYKFQPIVITSVNVNIPDDAAWETLTELNSEKWSYLNGIIRSPNIGKKYAQFPREAEIAISCNLLEKERAVIGGSHFGHAPTSDNDSNIFVTGNEPYLPNVTSFGAGMVTFTENEVVANSRWEARRTEATNRPGGLIGTPLQQ